MRRELLRLFVFLAEWEGLTAAAGVTGAASFSWNFWRHMGHFPSDASDSSQLAMQWMWKQCVHWPMTEFERWVSEGT
jgi:hypothetical protein